LQLSIHHKSTIKHSSRHHPDNPIQHKTSNSSELGKSSSHR